MHDPASAVASGVSFVCAHCFNFWEAHQRGLDQCLASAQGNTCTGPIGGGTFPFYRGPMESHLANLCFVCGARADAACQVDGQTRLIGVCSKHVHMLETYSSEGKPPPFVTNVRVPVLP